MAPERPFAPLFDEFPPVSAEAWAAKVKEDLGTADIDSVLEWESLEGISLLAYRRREDLGPVPHLRDEAAASPLVEDRAPANDWRLRQDIQHPDPDAARALARAAVQGGCSDLGLGADPFGKERPGLSLESPAALREVLRDVSLDSMRLHLDRGPAALVLYALLREALQDDPFARSDGGSVAYDPVAALATGSMRDESRAFEGLDRLLHHPAPDVRTLCVDLRPYHEAGASAVQELAGALGALSTLLADRLGRGDALPRLLDRLHMVVASSTSYFVEIAKLRALRLLVPQVVDAYADEYGSTASLAPADLTIQSETSRRTETLYDPYVNMLRGTTEAMAAVLGGCDLLTVRPYDACFRPADAFGTRIARNVQLILKHEAHFDVVADPAAGSYYVETTTHALAERAWSTFQDIEAHGGILETLKDGSLQARTAEVRRARRREVEDGDRVLVGTNRYPNLDEQRRGDVFSCNNVTSSPVDLAEVSVEALRQVLRDGHGGADLIRGLRQGTGPIDPLPRLRITEGLEALRLQTERFAEEQGHRPTVFLAPMGDPATRSARATFARHLFGVAGFDVHEPLGVDAPAQAVAAASDQGADVLVICSETAAYPDLVPAVRDETQGSERTPLLSVVAPPDELPDSLTVDVFLHRGTPLRETLASIQERLGIREVD